MCVVSFVGADDALTGLEDKWKPWEPYIQPSYTFTTTGPTQEEFDKLKAEVLEMKELLRKAKIYDEVNNEQDCEIEAKMEFLRQVAKLVGIELDDVLKPKESEEKSVGNP